MYIYIYIGSGPPGYQLQLNEMVHCRHGPVGVHSKGTCLIYACICRYIYIHIYIYIGPQPACYKLQLDEVVRCGHGVVIFRCKVTCPVYVCICICIYIPISICIGIDRLVINFNWMKWFTAETARLSFTARVRAQYMYVYLYLYLYRVSTGLPYTCVYARVLVPPNLYIHT